MADRDRKKALFRAKLNERQHQKRIDDPLVRYNEQDKPFCRVCKLVLKSESDWLPHKASRKHNEALDNLKANASRKNAVNTKSETTNELPNLRGVDSQKFNSDQTSMSSDVKKSRSSSALPATFFDNQDAKRQKVGSAQVERIDVHLGAASSNRQTTGPAQPTRITDNVTSGSRAKQAKGGLPEGFFDTKNADLPTDSVSQIQSTGTAENVTAGTQQAKGALPEGFFDNKDADLRARGIEPVKPDVKDEYKEFEKLIQEDLVELDNRFEEEEVDAAEQIEEEEFREQSTYRSKVEEIKRKKQELRAAMSARAGKTPEVSEPKSDQEDDSSSEDEEEDETSFAVDWRAQHL